MQLSLSVRIVEAATKDRLNIPLEEFLALAAEVGYRFVCLRASAAGVQTPPDELRRVRSLLEQFRLKVSMVTTDFDVPRNNDAGPNNLRHIGPHLETAEMLGADLIRVCMKSEDDIPAAQQAADEARPRGIRLAHQSHHNSLFETVEGSVAVLRRVDRENFGLIYEPGNLLLCGQDYGPEALRRLAPWMMNVYVQNHRLAADGPVRLPTRCRGEVQYWDIPLWESGGVDFSEVFRGLREIGYRGTVTVHQEFAKLMPPRQAAHESHRFLSRMIAQAAEP